MPTRPIFIRVLYMKHIKKSAILKFDTGNRNFLEGHKECMEFLKDSVANMENGLCAIEIRHAVVRIF